MAHLGEDGQGQCHARYTIIFPAIQHHHPFRWYRSIIGWWLGHVCEQFAQSHYTKCNSRDSKLHTLLQVHYPNQYLFTPPLQLWLHIAKLN